MELIVKVFLSKLKKIDHQLMAATLADYSYSDGNDALVLLRNDIRNAIIRVKDSNEYSVQTRDSILKNTNYLIDQITNILGLIIRSTSIRNAFELYAPFQDLSHSLVGADSHLIFSSEWNFIPFTYPQNIQQLPKFIIIGLPAPESDNVLVFPAAAHELGHSMWLAHGFDTLYADRIKDAVNKVMLDRKNDFDEVFPSLKGADFDQDMFVQNIKSEIFIFARLHIEEIFADIVGLILFGESYIYAFTYLIAPQASPDRSMEYPDTISRVEYLMALAKDNLKIEVKNYVSYYSREMPPADRREAYVLACADLVEALHTQEIYADVSRLVASTDILLPSLDMTDKVESSFRCGVPYDGEAALGDLVNAAWRIFEDEGENSAISQGRPLADFLTDLVLKSVEIYEIRKYDIDAGSS